MTSHHRKRARKAPTRLALRAHEVGPTLGVGENFARDYVLPHLPCVQITPKTRLYPVAAIEAWLAENSRLAERTQ